MKTLIILFSFLLIIASCNSTGNENTVTEAPDKYETFGTLITDAGAVPVSELPALLAGKDSLNIKLVGAIDEVCQKKGCWMMMNLNENETMMVKFYDYDFFMPKDAAGRTTIIEGVAFSETLSVEELKHYAEDGGQSQEEIDAITEPETTISFEATGVLIQK